MIKITGVSKTFRHKFSALKDVSFEVKEGEFLFLIGPSGAGKTTLFKILYGEEEADEGEVFYGDREISKLSRNDLAKLRRRIGVIFQDFRLLPTASVFENVALMLEVLEIEPDEIEPRTLKVLKLVGLWDRALSFPWQLSGGERQRVAVARALVSDPEIILADEPTAEVDPATTWGIMEILEKINKKGTTVMVATHDSEIVNSFKRRVIRLNEGRLIGDEKRGTYV